MRPRTPEETPATWFRFHYKGQWNPPVERRLQQTGCPGRVPNPFNESSHIKEQSDAGSILCAVICAKVQQRRIRYHGITYDAAE